ncbi:hypothetical protein EK21DRAFT_119048 [Setomelanomma holmii]|uniref:Uncharacterized protein n=1 Tax=Setomelanomma holmii TaxID=210430 RepID=A0A9P4LGG1_9PLEO|nr:hypothetical protein EK21DRAFT_119048 [Setomelanomma holmii]
MPKEESLSKAIKIILQAPEEAFTSPQLTQLKAKFRKDKKKSAELVNDSSNSIVQKVTGADTPDEIRHALAQKNLWTRIRLPLTAWELAGCCVSLPALSTPQRKLRKQYSPTFDLCDLSQSELDVVLILAFFSYAPLKRLAFSQIYQRCSNYAHLGQSIREKLQSELQGDRFLCRAFGSAINTTLNAGASMADTDDFHYNSDPAALPTTRPDFSSQFFQLPYPYPTPTAPPYAQWPYDRIEQALINDFDIWGLSQAS